MLYRIPALVLFASFGFFAACDSASTPPPPGPDGSTDATVESGPDGPLSEASNDDAGDTSVSEAAPDAPPDAASDADAGPCVAPLSTFGCPETYPSDLASACPAGSTGPAAVVTSAECGSLPTVTQVGVMVTPALAFGLAPHFFFCLYSGVDAGALVGAETVSDIDEFCDNASNVMVGGQVPSACASQIETQLPVSPTFDGPATVPCGVTDAASDDAPSDAPTDDAPSDGPSDGGAEADGDGGLPQCSATQACVGYPSFGDWVCLETCSGPDGGDCPSGQTCVNQSGCCIGVACSALSHRVCVAP